MDNWLWISIMGFIFLVTIGHYSTLHKNAKQKLRKKGLNDLAETLPRSHKKDHQLPTVPSDHKSRK